MGENERQKTNIDDKDDQFSVSFQSHIHKYQDAVTAATFFITRMPFFRTSIVRVRGLSSVSTISDAQMLSLNFSTNKSGFVQYAKDIEMYSHHDSLAHFFLFVSF